MTPLVPHSKVKHYYGDTVRLMYIAVALVYAVSMPLFGHLLPIGPLGGIGVVLGLVLLAGILNPHSKLLMGFSIAVSAVGLFFLQNAAITFFANDSVLLFMMRQVSAILFLVAFYHGVKSLRSMLLGTIGHSGSPDEFK